ncbi:hypothetical protein H5410_020987 [Solanum commersonii]|uniref:Uncharacterized protein n=1 Tax=Solanum commersonii TaxID=4109 RepID=A0A9J5ZAN9_SOLCO|nr:hypothetical protein H5410_020987 [Solanum commersonii]
MGNIRDVKIVNEKQKMARLITEERRVLTGSLHTVPDIHRLFNLHNHSRGSISKRSKPLAQDPLTSTLVRGCGGHITPYRSSGFSMVPCGSLLVPLAEFDY